MGPGLIEDELRGLRERIDRALRTGRPRDQVVPMLERLLQIAPAGGDTARFALRQLVEAHLARAPWRAALFAKRLIALDPRDDEAHALAGLCFALLGHFSAAVQSYRRAVGLSPANPWYAHNLGHLLDVTLRRPADALGHLRRAYRLEPTQSEVIASLAHCLGAVGRRDEALALLASASARSTGPEASGGADLVALRKWIEAGALAEHDRTVPGLLSNVVVSPASAAPSPSETHAQKSPGLGASRPARSLRDATLDPRSSMVRGGDAEVVELLARSYTKAHFAPEALLRARRLWADYQRAARPTLGRAAVYAASVEYALSRIDGVPASQRALAERYGVSVSSLQNRYAAMRATLRLAPSDARYARRAPASASAQDPPVAGRAHGPGPSHARAPSEEPRED